LQINSYHADRADALKAASADASGTLVPYIAVDKCDERIRYFATGIPSLHDKLLFRSYTVGAWLYPIKPHAMALSVLPTP
jgi:hypothetical protein